jgi:hypothetical protein
LARCTRPVFHFVRPIIIERPQPQVIAQPVYFPQPDVQTSSPEQQPRASDDATPAPPVDTPGDAAIKDQQAQILAQQARALANENNLKQTEGLIAQKKKWSDERAQSQLDREARLEHGRQLLAERRRTAYRAAYLLPANQLNVSTGEISWPTRAAERSLRSTPQSHERAVPPAGQLQ